MAVGLALVVRGASLPTVDDVPDLSEVEDEVAAAGPDEDGNEEPHVVRHGDQHHQVPEANLYEVQQGLEQMEKEEGLLSVGLN